MIMEMQNDDSEEPESDDNSYIQIGVCVCKNNYPFDPRAT